MRSRLLILVACLVSTVSIYAADAVAEATQVANTFYVDYLVNYRNNGDSEKFVLKSSALTPEFKSAYSALLAKAWKADPELGLDHDPIIGGQDAPDEGYQVKTLKIKSDGAHAVLVSHNPGFKDPINVWLIQQAGQWRINGINDLVGR